MSENTIPDVEEKDTIQGILESMKKTDSKSVGKAVSQVVYVAAIAYAEVHSFNLLTTGVPDEYIPIALVGIFALGITALLMPFAKSNWFAGKQYGFGKWFHWADLGLLFFNAVVDFAFNTGGVLPGWLQLYSFYVLPVTPLIVAAGWVMIWELDPDEEERLVIQQQEQAFRLKFSKMIAKAIDNQEIVKTVTDEVNDTVPVLVGRFLRSAKQSRGIRPSVDVQITKKDQEHLGSGNGNFTNR